LGPENAGVPQGRNALLLPDGRAFFSAAPLGPDAGARWLATGDDGRLLFLDDRGRTIGEASGYGDEAAAIGLPCSANTHVLLSSKATRAAQDLRVFRVVDRQLLPVSPALLLPGPLTALWTRPTGDRALAVAHNAVTGRHEAYDIAAACVR
jgi:hypothetical protein